jgi:hypothetical protein
MLDDNRWKAVATMCYLKNPLKVFSHLAQVIAIVDSTSYATCSIAASLINAARHRPGRSIRSYTSNG